MAPPPQQGSRERPGTSWLGGLAQSSPAFCSKAYCHRLLYVSCRPARLSNWIPAPTCFKIGRKHFLHGQPSTILTWKTFNAHQNQPSTTLTCFSLVDQNIWAQFLAPSLLAPPLQCWEHIFHHRVWIETFGPNLNIEGAAWRNDVISLMTLVQNFELDKWLSSEPSKLK